MVEIFPTHQMYKYCAEFELSCGIDPKMKPGEMASSGGDHYRQESIYVHLLTGIREMGSVQPLVNPERVKGSLPIDAAHRCV